MADESKISRALSIARRIQGPVVILEETAEPVVIVPLGAYEELISALPRKSLTPSTASATINRDIAFENPGMEPLRSASRSGVSSAEGADEQYYMEPLE